ncbi:MAG: ArnT family glycosyltransferase, partial [Planctomycetota bacterium]
MGRFGASEYRIYWAGNARTPLWDRDEPRFAQAAREMLESGDYVVPRFHGRTRFDKPVLGYYSIAAGMKAFGPREFGARFLSSVFGALSLVVLFRLALRITRSPRAALYSAAMLAVAPVMFVESKLCTVDVGLLLWVLLAFTGLWRIYEGPCPLAPKALFWFALAAAVLTKGPVALAAVFVPVVLVAIVARDRSFLKRIGWLWGVPLLAALCAPWVMAVQRATGGEFLRVALGKHVVGRAAAAMESHRGFPGFYVATLFVTFFPWAFYVPGAVAVSLKRLRDRKAEMFLLCWAAGLIVVLELVKTKMVHYSLPVFPALSILAAIFIEKGMNGRRRLLFAGTLAATLMAGALAAGPVAALAKAEMREAIFPFAAAGAVLLAGTFWVLMVSRKGAFVGKFAAVMFCWLFLVAAWGLPAVGLYSLTPRAIDLIEQARTEVGENASVAALGYKEPSLVFYLGGEVTFLDGFEDLQSEGRRAGPRILLLSREYAGAFAVLPGRFTFERGTARGF